MAGASGGVPFVFVVNYAFGAGDYREVVLDLMGVYVLRRPGPRRRPAAPAPAPPRSCPAAPPGCRSPPKAPPVPA
ncbi:hypothetical protein AB0H16_11290, partial [Streptomyces lydicus]